MTDNPQPEIKLSSRSLTHLFITLSRVKRKINEKEKKRIEFLNSIERIKKFAEGTTKKSVIIEELKKLESKVDKLIEEHVEEQDLLMRLQKKYDIPKDLQVKPFQDFEKISWKLKDNVMKLKKVEEENKIITGKIIENEQEVIGNKLKELEKLELELKNIENKYNKLKKSGKYGDEELKRLEGAIYNYKKIIGELKSKNNF
ncbi:MAG: hypothetical protein QXG86_00785 [Candidatus Woesearchaeota archaeon]